MKFGKSSSQNRVYVFMISLFTYPIVVLGFLISMSSIGFAESQLPVQVKASEIETVEIQDSELDSGFSSELSPELDGPDTGTSADISAVRRERKREERRTEELLKVRLEELRLEDEQRRTSVVKAGGSAGTPLYRATQSKKKTNEKMLYVRPGAGLANLTSTEGYDVKGRFSAGVTVGVFVNDLFAVEGGYNFNEYGVNNSESGIFTQAIQTYQSNSLGTFVNPNLESTVMKQNVFEAGLKYHPFGRRKTFRPFVSGGGAYSKSNLNYDDNVIAQLSSLGIRDLGTDYQVSSFLGYISGGLDVQINPSISIGGVFKYYGVLSSSENVPLNNFALYGSTLNGGFVQNYYGGFVPYYQNLADAEKQITGGTLSDSGFYTAQVGLTLAF